MSDYLAHHGRLHMKWGVKNGPPYPLGSDVTKGYAKRQEAHDDYKKAHNKGEHKKSVKEMSDAELRSRINRLQMERQYSDMTSKGKQAVNKTLKVLGATAATAGTLATLYKNYSKIKKVAGRVLDRYGDKLAVEIGEAVANARPLAHSAKNSERKAGQKVTNDDFVKTVTKAVMTESASDRNRGKR